VTEQACASEWSF